MEILDIRVEYASGFTIIDRAILIPELFEVSTSERVASVMREFALTEAPPRVSVTIRGQSVELEQGVGGHFVVPEGAFESGSGCRWWLRVLRGFVPQTKGSASAVRPLDAHLVSGIADRGDWFLAFDFSLDVCQHSQ
jgi:hypothetical protein